MLLDEEQPSCRRCANAGYECEGYPSGLRFVFDKASAQPKEENSATGSKPCRSRINGLSPAGDYQGILVRQRLQGLSLAAASDTSSSRGSIYHSYLVENFLKHIQIGQGSFTSAWDSRSPTTEDSVGALAAAFYGRVQHQQRISQQGAVLYGQALTKLAQDLNNNETIWSVSVLLSVIALAFYEVRLSFPRNIIPPSTFALP